MIPDLVERVARAIFDAEYGSHNWGENGCRPMMRAAAKQARAAIAIVLEEAEREAASVSNPFITNREQFSRCMGWTEAQDEIVHAIRALKGDE